MRQITVFVGGPFSAAMRREDSGTIGFDPRLKASLEEVHSNIQQLGVQLLSAHIADSYGQKFEERGIVPRDGAWTKHCDLYVVLMPLDPAGHPYRSDGSYIEVGLAIAYNKRVVLVVEDPQHPEQSYFVRNLDGLSGIRLLEWNDFFGDIRRHLETELLEILGDALPSSNDCVPREQTTNPEEVLARLALQTSVESVEVRGAKIQVLPGVFSPRFSHCPDFMISNWRIPKGAKVLDLGCGCGILGLFALREEARFSTFLDSNQRAVENTLLNLKEHRLRDRALVLASDVDSALPPAEQFDVILLSLPYWDRPAKTPLAAACYDEGYRFMRRAIEALPRRLYPDGDAFIVFSDQGDVSLLTRLIGEQGLKITDFRTQRPTMPVGHVRVFYHIKR